MPFITNPEFQKFVAQETGLAPMDMVRKVLPSAPPVGKAVFEEGSPLGYQMGQALYDNLEGKQFLKPLGSFVSSLGQNSGRAAGMTALALGLGGAGFGALTDRNPLALGLIGAGVGGLAGYGASELTKYLMRRRQLRGARTMWERKQEEERQQRVRDYYGPPEPLPVAANPAAAPLAEKPAAKRAAYYGMGNESPITYIQSRLFADSSMAASDKAVLMSSLRSLPRPQLMQLSDMLRGVAGAAVGYLITRFLMGTGGLGQSVGAAAGAFLGMSLGSKLPYNSFGQPVDTQFDVFGGQRFVF